MDKTKKTIEGALFISGRWLNLDDLVRISGTGSVAAVRQCIMELQTEYEQRDGGIKMAKEGSMYRLEIDPEVREKVYYLAPEPELSPALIKTLALIAYKQPIYQSGVVKVIGNRAYQYIKELRKKEFISVKKKGRTKLLSTTGRFNKYFGIPEGEKFKPELGTEILQEAQKKLDEVIEEAEIDDELSELRDEDKNKALEEQSEDNNEDGSSTEEAEEKADS